MTDSIKIDYKLDDKQIKNAIKELSTKISIKVGILGGNGSNPVKGDDDKLGNITMATLGAIHEFGSEKINIPSRSFLQMPIETRFKDELGKNVGFKTALKELNVTKLNDEAGVTATVVIDDAFASGGFGSWVPLKEETIRRKTKNGKRGDAILIDTGDLRRSITYEVVKQ